MASTYTARVQFLGLTEAENSLKSLAKTLRQLKAEQAQTDVGSAKYRELTSEIGRVQAQLNGLREVQKDVTKAFEAQGKVAGSFAALKAETKALTVDFNNMAVGINATQEEYDALAKTIQANNLKITNLNRELRGSKSIAERFREGAVAAFKDVAIQVTAAVGAVQGFNAIKNLGSEFLDIERGFAKVNTVAQLSNDELTQLKTTVLDLGRDATVELSTIPDALFTIQSATGDVEQSQTILAASLRAAKAGFGDLQSTAQAGVGIFGAVKNQVSGIDEVFDTLFRTQKEGLLTFSDLSAEFPKVVPSIQALGAGFQESAAALATFTKFGFSANAGATALDATLKGLAKTQVQENLKDIGVAVFDATGKTRPLVSIVGDLSEQFKGLSDEQRSLKLAGLGLDENAAKGLNSLTSNLKTFEEVSKSIVGGSAGELDRQFAASANTADDLKIATNNLKVELIQNLGPAFDTIAKGGVNLLRGLAQLVGFLIRNRDVVLILTGAYAALNAARIQAAFLESLATKGTILNTAATIANNLATRAAAIGQAILGTASQVLAGKIGLATIAQRALNLVMNANPLGLVIAGVTALGAALVLLSSRTKELTREQQLQKELGDAVAENYGKETAGSAALFAVLKSETSSREERAKAMTKINEQYGQYLPSLLTEASSLKEVEAAQNAVNAALLRKVQLQVQEQKITEIFTAQQNALLRGTETLTKATGLSQQKIQDALNSVTDVFKAATAEQILQVGLTTSSFEGTLDEVVKLAKVGPEVQKSLDAIKASGVALDFLDLASAVGQGNKEIDNINKFFNDQAPLQVFGDNIVETTGSLGDAADTVKLLREEIKLLQDKQELATNAKEWAAIGAEIKEVENKIKKITGDSKTDKKATDDQKKLLADRLKAEEENANKIAQLRKQLAETIAANIEDDIARELAQEELRYRDRLQLAINNAAEIIAAETSTAQQREDAIQVQNALIEQLETEHQAKVLDITEKGEKARLDREVELEAKRTAQMKGLLDIRLDTVQTELELAGKNFDKRKELLTKEKDLRIQLLDLETANNLKAATSDEERTAILERATVERTKIITDFAANVEASRKGQGSILSRILGIDDKELQQFGQVFKGFQDVALQAVDQFFEAQKELIDQQVTRAEERIDALNNRLEDQRNRLKQVEESLLTATGERRERIIQLIEIERKREAQLAADREVQERRKLELLNQAAEIEKKQAAIRKAQAIAQAVINTALGISRVIADVPKADFGISTGILIALYGALGAAQVATIAAQKFAKGGKLDGPSHDNGGIPVWVSGQNRMVEAEGQEWMINKRASANNDHALETINRHGDRVKFDVVPKATQSFATGGRLDLTPDLDKMQGAAQFAQSQAVIDSLTGIRKAIETMPAQVVVATDVSEAQRMDANRRSRIRH